MVAIGFSSLKRGVALSAILCGALAGCASTQQQTSQAELSPAQSNVPHPNTNPTAVGNAAVPGAGTTAVASAAPGPSQTTTALSKSGRIQSAQPETGSAQTAQLQPEQLGQIQQGQLQAAQDRMGQLLAGQPQAANQGQAAIAAATGANGTTPSASAAYAASDEPPVPSVVAIPIPNPSRPGEAASMQAVADNASADQSPIGLTPEMVAIQSVVPTPRPGDALPVTEIAYATPSPQLAYADNRMHYDYNFDTTGPSVVPAVLTESNNNDDVSPTEKNYISRLIQKYARIYEVPESLIHRVVHRESRYNPKAYNRAGYFGLMQIKYNTAKSMGYDGPPTGLLDAETNIKYAAKYLRGAWMVSDSKPDDAVALYARGYYYDAKNKGMLNIANGEY